MIEPCVFGNLFWTSLHLLSFDYDPVDKDRMKAYILSLGAVLPCPSCRDHFAANITQRLPINDPSAISLDQALQSKDLLTKWLYDFHNLVNEQTGKPANTWPTFQEVQNVYEPLLKKTECAINTCHSDSNDIYCKVSFVKTSEDLFGIKGLIILILIFVIVCLGYYILRRKKTVR
jgi:hypothetical protein